MDSKLIKHKAFKPLLLKDYLLDDMSSCSSNGFKSFPRRQCCATTVRFLIEIDLNTIKQRKKKSAISAFHSVIAAVKRLPFAASENVRLKKSILPRSLSKRILKKSIFWKRKSEHKEISIQRWKSFDQLLKEDSEPLDAPNSSIATINDGGNSSSEVNLNFTAVKRNDVEELKLKDGEVSGDSTTREKQWGVSEEKQQFSPVSVLDCPFQDDEEVSSPFQRMEGTTKKLMEKIQRFGNLDQLEPLNLAKRFASDSDDESTGSHSSASEEEEKALDLLHRLKKTLPSCNVKAEKLLLDFLREKTMHSEQGPSFDVVLKEAERWINGGEIHEPFLGWEVQRNRQAYMNDMERLGEWRCLDQELEGVGLELGDAVFDALFDELLVDISSTTRV